MVTLLTYAGDVSADAPVLRTGGVPLAPADFEWPLCASCDGAMMFLAHLPVEAGVLSVFMCQNDPGLCEEWDPAGGGNRAYLFPAGTPLQAAAPPVADEDDEDEDEPQTALPVVTGLTTTTAAEDAYPAAVESWTSSGNDRHDALGQLGGTPTWLQADETPTCPDCDGPMDLAAMLEQGRDYQTGMNFGGDGWGYVFACAGCARATFLWQC